MFKIALGDIVQVQFNVGIERPVSREERNSHGFAYNGGYGRIVDMVTSQLQSPLLERSSHYRSPKVGTPIQSS